MPMVLFRGQPVHVLKREGYWAYVEARGKSGWVQWPALLTVVVILSTKPGGQGPWFDDDAIAMTGRG